MKTTGTVKLDDIKFDGSIYPRLKPSSSVIDEYTDAIAGGDKFPPIILETGTNRLLDGYHRWKAYCSYRDGYQLRLDQANGFDLPEPLAEIPCEYHIIPDGVSPKLYALFLSSRHGHRPTTAEKEQAAQDQFRQHPGSPIKEIAKYIGVSPKTAKSYIKPLLAEFEETKRSIIMRLDMLGWTQDEMSDMLQAKFPEAQGTTQMAISRFLNENGNFRFRLKNDFDLGHSPETIAKRHNLPEILVWALKLQDLSDQEKMEAMEIPIQPYDVWNFSKCHDLFGASYPGRIPGQLVAHVLYFFTEPGAMVIDPMAGSGTVPDVCLAFGRKCYGYDVDLRPGRPDIIRHDLSEGWPDRLKKADLIFWDPPYFEKMDSSNIGLEGYTESSISKLDRESYLAFFAGRLAEAKAMVKPGMKLVFLMSDWDDNAGKREGIFIWDYANVIREAGWNLIRHIQVPLSTQQVHPDIVGKFRKSRRLARLERYLLIVEA